MSGKKIATHVFIYSPPLVFSEEGREFSVEGRDIPKEVWGRGVLCRGGKFLKGGVV